MTMVNASNSANHNNNTRNAVNSSSSTDAISTAKNNTALSEPDNDYINVSTRAEKLNLLSEEFFSRGTIQLKELPALVERLEEYGFISADDARGLENNLGVSDNSEEGETNETAAVIDSLIDMLAKEEGNTGVVTALGNAKSIIESIDRPQSPISKAELSQSISEIETFLGSDRSESLTNGEKQQLAQLGMIMKISDQFQQDQLSTNSINHYLSNSY